MASNKKIIEMIGAIKVIYPYYAKDTDVEMLVKTWGVLLNSYSDNAVEAAFYKCLQICKMPPTPADIIEQLNEIIKLDTPTRQELWNDFLRILQKAKELEYRFDFTFVEANGKTQGQNARKKFDKLYNDMPDELKQYIGGKGELIRLSRSNDEELKFERDRFMKTLPTIQSRKESAKLRKQIKNETFTDKSTEKLLFEK